MRVARPVFFVLICAGLAFTASSSASSVPGAAVPVQARAVSLGSATPDGDDKIVPDPSVASPAAPATPAVAAGLAPIGALFNGDGHYCSGSVIHSQAGDLVLTAAHCIHEGQGGDYISGISFAPGYHDGVAPFGMWTVTKEVVSQGWIDTSDPALDVGFVTVHQNGNADTVESVTGANKLGIGQGFTNQITVTGYPDDAESPVTCTNSTTKQSNSQERIACAGFPDGTSGSPWVADADPTTNLGTVIGVIGGYELGGDTADVSYSSYFDSDVEQLYNQTSSLG